MWFQQLTGFAEENPEQKNHLKEKPEIANRLHAPHKEWAKETLATAK